jgi:hypothetical protein
MTDDERQVLQDCVDTRRLLDAIDDVDMLRSVLANDGQQPPEIRASLLALHKMTMAVINDGSQHQVAEMSNLALELEEEVADLSEAVLRLHETLVILTTLRPDGPDPTPLSPIAISDQLRSGLVRLMPCPSNDP